VIAPYATALAAMVDPALACGNFARLAQMGASGRFGFYEALDFTPSRLPQDAGFAIVRCFMAHHQGMTIVSIANALHRGEMRERFHREPMIQACELLLQERVPRGRGGGTPARRGSAGVACAGGSRRPGGAALALRRGRCAQSPILLSNGRYSVMLTADGGGYSRWRDIAVTRWREDATATTGARSCSCATPKRRALVRRRPPRRRRRRRGVVRRGPCGVHRARRLARTRMDVLVSGEDDGEVRRVLLVNSGRRARESS
jgi:cyclic beta-1,2-glucan synthetase